MIITEVRMSAGPSLYRPVVETSWMPELHDFVMEHYPLTVEIYDGPVVNMVKTTELEHFTNKFGDSKEYIEGCLFGSAAPTLTNPLEDLRVTGVTYTNRTRKDPVAALVVKFAEDVRLVEENEHLLGVLADYGVRHRGQEMFFSAIIGRVRLRHMDGNNKQQLRYGLSDRTPSRLSLGPLVIDWPDK